MKAVILKSPGGLSQLHFIDLDDPGKPGPHEIRVRILASSLNYHDYGVVKGNMRMTKDVIPMADASGIVEEAGEGVTEFKKGDHVISCFFPSWLNGDATIGDFKSVPGDGVDGYAREAVVLPATHFVHAPKNWSHTEAATLTTAGLTSWRSLIVDGKLRPGETVLVMGSGGVSVFALQLAKKMGAKVIATSSSDEKLEKFKTLGADLTINYKSNPDWGSTAKEWTEGKGVDHIIEVGGPLTLPQSIRAIRVGGHISLIGVLTGRSGDIPTALLMARQARLQGLIVGSRHMMMDYVRALDTLAIRPVIHKTFSWQEIRQAFEYQESGKHFGKICLSME